MLTLPVCSASQQALLLERHSGRGTLHTRLGTCCLSPTRPVLHPQGFAGTRATRKRKWSTYPNPDVSRDSKRGTATSARPPTKSTRTAWEKTSAKGDAWQDYRWIRPSSPTKSLQTPAAAPSPSLRPEVSLTTQPLCSYPPRLLPGPRGIAQGRRAE